MSKVESQVQNCNPGTFARGLRISWQNEMRPFLWDLLLFCGVVTAFIVVVAIAVHVLFPLGTLVAHIIPTNSSLATISMWPFEHAPEVVVAYSAMGAAPIFVSALLVFWAMHTCTLGQQKE